jgi:hypothetical protein
MNGPKMTLAPFTPARTHVSAHAGMIIPDAAAAVQCPLAQSNRHQIHPCAQWTSPTCRPYRADSRGHPDLSVRLLAVRVGRKAVFQITAPF